MRRALLTLVVLCASASPLFASEGGGNLLSPNGGLMFWTLIIFAIFFGILWRFALPALVGAVEAREQSLRDALDAAARDREAAAAKLAEVEAQLAGARTEAQQLIANGRSAADKLRADLIEQAKAEQTAMLDRARKEIDNEKARAIDDLRREAVELALKGAGKVIEKNLDDATNRQLVESFLASVGGAVRSK
ncbi:MAG: F0F1 ATP synthase subunit B [Gemmatimonadaceae bacterium]|nr:F0F1 ATP synthase subunit B [Gemmatimonadaceae bacterium]